MLNVRSFLVALFAFFTTSTHAEIRTCGYVDMYSLFMAEGRFENLKETLTKARSVYANNEKTYCVTLDMNVSALRNACTTLASGPCKRGDNSVLAPTSMQSSCRQFTSQVENAISRCKKKQALHESAEPAEVDVAADESASENAFL